MSKNFIFFPVLAALAVFITGCSLAKVTPALTLNITQPVIKTATKSPVPTNTIAPTNTQAITPTVTITPLPTETAGPVVYGPTNFPEDVDPLTGLKVSDPSILDRRPVAVKINIVPRRSNRPPWGLAFADIVYDYYHNAGYSRFHAIFYGNNADLAGPIRSGRMPDYELVHMYKSMFVYGSADALINQRLLHSDFSDRVLIESYEADCPPTSSYPLCRIEPNTTDFLLANTADVSKYMESEGVNNSRQNLDGMSFNSTIQAGGVDGKQLFVRYSGDNYTRWDYDSATGQYLRFQDKVWDQGQGEEYEPLTEEATDKQLSAANVVVILARHEYYQEPPAEIIEILLSGTGKAYAFRDGKMYEVRWNRPTTDSVLSLSNPDGTPFPFKPGSTWFQIVNETNEAQKQDDGSWRFQYTSPSIALP